MRRLLTTSLLAISLIAAAPALAKSRGFDTTISAPLTTSVKIEIVLSEDMAHRANNLPEDRSRRGANFSRITNNGFAQNGFYGDRDLEYLQDTLLRNLEKRFAKKGIQIDDNAAAVLRVIIEDAHPNRPTLKQLSKSPSLSFRSLSIGGAEIAAQLTAADGSSLGDMSYRYFETDIRDSSFGGTWHDANRAIQRFAVRAAKTLQN